SGSGAAQISADAAKVTAPSPGSQWPPRRSSSRWRICSISAASRCSLGSTMGDSGRSLSHRTAAQNPFALQLLHLVWRIAEPLRQDLLIMLTQHRRLQIEGLGKGREPQREARHVEIPQYP